MLHAYNKDEARWSVSILGNHLQDFIWVRPDNLAVVASGAGGGTAGATATQRRPGLHTEGGYTLTMRAGGGGEIGAVFNGNESYDEEDRYHPHPPHLETHCLQYQEGWPWMGSKAYAMQWGQGSVYADFAESGDDEEYCGSCDKDETACGLTSISTAVASSPPTNMCGCSRTHFLFPIAVERQARFLC